MTGVQRLFLSITDGGQPITPDAQINQIGSGAIGPFLSQPQVVAQIGQPAGWGGWVPLRRIKVKSAFAPQQR